MFNIFTKKNVVNITNVSKICFTGHRPKDLPWGYDEKTESCVNFKKFMYCIIEKAIQSGYTYFISGMALGIDIICAEIVLKLKNKYQDIILECALPCIHQYRNWSLSQKRRYKTILHKADVIFYVNHGEYTSVCMNNRNSYMVQQSDIVIAVWNGKRSGTGNTVKLAKNAGKKIRIINPYNPK